MIAPRPEPGRQRLERGIEAILMVVRRAETCDDRPNQRGMTCRLEARDGILLVVAESPARLGRYLADRVRDSGLISSHRDVNAMRRPLCGRRDFHRQLC
ncbi:hypothetical protein ABT120_26060 [Nonomuraea angiospora]|uniref:hypothetical protein n=1 Tax=Nonomuraea angiospora TaxID=46172 RepID=UPI0033254204